MPQMKFVKAHLFPRTSKWRNSYLLLMSAPSIYKLFFMRYEGRHFADADDGVAHELCASPRLVTLPSLNNTIFHQAWQRHFRDIERRRK